MKNIPNILSLIRILLIPAFCYQFLVGNTLNSAIILAISGFTDFLDGFLARKFNWITQLGKVLDPAADKLTQVAVCIVFVIKMRTYWPFFVILLLKDLIMLILASSVINKGVKIEGADWQGKVSTFLFYTVIIVILFFPNLPHWAIITMLSASTIMSVSAAIMYIPDYKRYKKEGQLKEKNS